MDMDISATGMSLRSRIPSNAFKNNTYFNADGSGWDTSSVTTMGQMFRGAQIQPRYQ